MTVQYVHQIPNALTILRGGLAIPVYLLLVDYQVTAALCLLSVAMLTDVLDGYLARRLKVCSAWGAYADSTADFLVVMGGFHALTTHGVYPFWLPLLLIGMFGQFVLTSRQQLIYDPIGKYYGAALYGTIIALILLPDLLLSYALLLALLGMSTVSISTRAVSLLRHTPAPGMQPHLSP